MAGEPGEDPRELLRLVLEGYSLDEISRELDLDERQVFELLRAALRQLVAPAGQN